MPPPDRPTPRVSLKQSSWGGFGPSALIALLGLVATLAACIGAERWEANQDRTAFERRASALAVAIARSFQLTREVVLSIPALFESSTVIEQEEFRTFVRPALARHPSLAALEWAPLVHDVDRAAFVEQQRRQGFPGFEIREPDASGAMVRSAQRDMYLPLTYMLPEVEAVRGLELLFEPVRRIKIEEAIDQGTLHVSDRFKLVEDPEGVQSLAVYAGGYDPRNPLANTTKRRAALLGLGVALFRLQPLIDAALANQEREGIELALVDTAAPADLQVLYETVPGIFAGVARAGMAYRESFDFGNRSYSVWSVASLGSTWSQWLAFGVGLGLTLLAAGSHAAFVVIRRLRREVKESVMLGQYTLQEKIGSGGMGVVYRATHAMLRRPAAIKLLLPEHHNQEHVARFEREVQLTSRLTHPNTISIFDYGRTAQGVFYYVMEFVDGIDLERLIEQEGPLAPARAIHILLQASGALAEAHAMGLIHGDVKPANIVLCERADAPDVVKIVDFGLARTLEKSAGDSGSTSLDGITGTPMYLAPEAVSTPSALDARADLYSLGAVGYFMLTGKHVFDGTSVLEVLTKHLLEEPVPPSIRSGKALASDLEGVLLGCLAKDRQYRPSSAQALADSLRACADAARYDADAAKAWWHGRGAELRQSARREPARAGIAATMAIDMRGRSGAELRGMALPLGTKLKQP
jgi:CHASE1-domain containing sensor protein